MCLVIPAVILLLLDSLNLGSHFQSQMEPGATAPLAVSPLEPSLLTAKQEVISGNLALFTLFVLVEILQLVNDAAHQNEPSHEPVS